MGLKIIGGIQVAQRCAERKQQAETIGLQNSGLRKCLDREEDNEHQFSSNSSFYGHRKTYELASGGTQKHKGKVGCLLKAELVSQKSSFLLNAHPY